ncbi:LysR substrate-binding domain-containing protein [Burkholderia vietnamiensis]|uniref:LysR substrate-binding domain-containing protein n=1 Tax=Burkholderia vietnamiensis TaxID=60552 RepID=UPI0009C130D3|nr:LysR substrate-binding domain-containing protein [Burkholderia vietnamiensis]MDN7924084.1 LysR substrate-binding domain-containing protein [Burkholderia vietnamiensis]HDR9249209.1 hypothetical protein [Burkholderia vietnamiensis]
MCTGTVFRNLRRIERGLQQQLFERTRSGYRTKEIGLALAEHAEQAEVQVESARSIAQQAPEQVGGTVAGKVRWIAPDDALPGHPSVIWRKRHFRKVVPHYKVNSILTVMELVALGMGVGILPTFLTRGRSDLVQLTDVLHDCQTELWVLTHRESRHLRRVSTVFKYLSTTLKI